MLSAKANSVLIVEDERIVAKDLQQTLADMGYDAFAIASSADQAIARASERCPDVVLMDIRIKGQRDGVEAAAVLRERFGVPVVFLTAHADDATIERAKRTEPHGYLVKPVKSAELRSAIEVAVYRHEMEKRLRERERWFSTTLRSIADAVITVDIAGKITFMNPAAEVLTGITFADGVGRPARDVVRLVDAEAGVQSETPLDCALQQRRTVELPEARLLGAGATSRIIGDSAAPVVDKEELLGAVMVFRDVTEQKLLQKQLELADRLSSLGSMAAGVAHEVNNPLAVVMVNAAFVLEEMARVRIELGSRGDGQNEDLIRVLDEAEQAQADIQSAASRIGRIVADLKVFSRPAPQASGDADVGRAIAWAIRTTAHEFRHRARLTTHVAEVPLAQADETKLGQVLLNLLMNAAHAIAPGNVEGNEVSVRAATDEANRVIIEVTDTGCGMAPDVLERIFEPFFTTKTVGEGTGLGLSICHGIVNSLGGQIQVESAVGKGSVVRVLLPPATHERREVALAGPVASPTRETVLRGRILVIDDEKTVLRALKRILADHDLVCTESAREALGMIERGETFDLIFSDVMMPMMTGIEFYETLLERNLELARRVVFISGGAVTAKVESFLRSVPNLRIEKPFEVVNLRETVQHLLASQSPEPTPLKVS